MSVSFPKPLTEKEEKFYIKQYEQGDLQARHILIERNLRLVAHVAKKYATQPQMIQMRSSTASMKKYGYSTCSLRSTTRLLHESRKS